MFQNFLMFHSITATSLKPLLITIVGLLIANCNTSCLPPTAEVVNTAYAAETAMCVQTAETLKDSRRCRATVNWKYGLCPAPGPLPCDLKGED